VWLQGWFGAPGDGRSQPDWRHWTKEYGALADGNAKVDLWPDVSELDASQRSQPVSKWPMAGWPKFQFLFKADGAEALPVDAGLRHRRSFCAAFCQRRQRRSVIGHCNTVLASCREGANLHGRTYAVMYDLSGLPADTLTM